MVSIGIAQTFIFDFILFRRSHRPALRKMTLDWFQKLAAACRAAAEAAATINAAEPDDDAVAAASHAAEDLAKASKGAQATFGVAKFEPPCQRPFDAAGFEHLLDAQAAAGSAMTTLAGAIKTYVGTREDHRSRMLLHATKRLADQADAAAAAAPADLPTVLAAFEDVRVALLRAREEAWDAYFDRENPQPLDEAIGNEASLARMTALGAVETVCFHVARAAGEVDNLGLPPPKKDD
ncbi:unnamed protein product [Pelagomonas calceolata]|uniref:Uncharacterized protein n=1 Tax=Pelagomonas calceolata TaxID=35677 RepID=A0A8J2SKQ4_9STRA|nr:unnamed protein product [Pelagomonas calceolata]